MDRRQPGWSVPCRAAVADGSGRADAGGSGRAGADADDRHWLTVGRSGAVPLAGAALAGNSLTFALIFCIWIARRGCSRGLRVQVRVG